ncbi:MAG: saccharopine dehydrogenase [Ornithinimicrobium sp.]
MNQTSSPDQRHHGLHLWMRAEVRSTERRAPITPTDARALIGAGAQITVERSAQRVFEIAEYAEAGAHLADSGSWVDAPPDAYIVGIKELPEAPAELRHTHIYFAHAYKGQDGAAELLGRFERGGGELLDIEYLTLDHRRVVAFGYWAGYVGASLSLLQAHGALAAPLAPMARGELDKAVQECAAPTGSALVIGARGRSGRGAVDALRGAGWTPSKWGLAETTDLDTSALLDHEILINCVVSHRPQKPFVTSDDITAPGRRLRVIGDVTCDVTSANNALPINTSITTWEEPVRRFGSRQGADPTGAVPPLDVIAIDNLPSLLPLEASVSFSADFTPWLVDLAARSGPFAAAQETFRQSSGHRG